MRLLVTLVPPIVALVIGIIIGCSVKSEDVVEIAEKIFGPEPDTQTRRKT